MSSEPEKILTPCRTVLPSGRAGSVIAAAAVLFLILGTGMRFTVSAADDHVALAHERERTLKPGDTFQECTKCPAMVVVPAGSFVMGSPPTEKDHLPNEGPQHNVTIAKPFAVSKFELTFDEWDACVAHGDCAQGVGDAGWGRGQQPVIYVTWDYAQRYVAWLSKLTGKSYRLLSEPEYEYAARAGTRTAYPWGNEIGKNNANCIGCGGQQEANKPVSVGSFAVNGFGLYDMVGNVWEWVEDCVHNNYNGAPQDGSAWIEGGDCSGHVVRGGSWFSSPQNLRSASRSGDAAGNRSDVLGLRVGRTLDQ